MLFSRDWLGDYVALPDGVDDLAARLTRVGLAVEGVEERGDDRVLDVEVTTNRPDAMCHLGLARELAVASGVALRAPRPALEEVDPPASGEIEVRRESDGDCPRYVARLVRGVEVGPSPPWLAERLAAIGLRPINHVVDVTNYVLWETGQPLHAFDRARLAGGRVEVRRARAGERLRTLDGEERELDPGILVIADAERPVALAGIMGGEESEVTAETVDVVLESAHFDPLAVRRGARRLGLHTDASHRFERGADPEACLLAADRAAGLLVEVAGGEVARGAVDSRGAVVEPLAGTLDLDRLDAFAGVAVPAERVEEILAGLGFEPRPAGDRRLAVTVPSWRHYDLAPGSVAARREGASREVWEADFFEEVLRHHGFDAVPVTLPAIPGPDAGSSEPFRARRRLADALVACGLVETISYGFYSLADDSRFPGVGGAERAVDLANPLSELYARMRRSLLPGLVASAGFNLRRGAAAARLFEIGTVFHLGGDGDGGEPVETEKVGLVVGGVPGTPWDGARELDFFDLKGVVESVAERAGESLRFRPGELPGMVPGTGAEIVSGDGRRCGIAGRVDDPDLPVALFAAELDAVPLAGSPGPHPVELPGRFPGIELDHTLTHARTTPWSELAEAVGEAADPRLTSFRLKDRYSGKGVPPGAVNTTMTFFYSSPEHSLTQEEILEVHEAIVARLGERFAWREER